MNKISKSSTKRKVKLYTVEYGVTQGEIDIEKIENRVLSFEDFGKRRPRKSEGWWKLPNGDWARRLDAIFVKDHQGRWVEIKKDDADSSSVIGQRPVQDYSKLLHEREASELL